MPKVTYKGPYFARRRPDKPGEFTRGETIIVAQEWLNRWRNRLPESHFTVEGDSGVTVDLGDDGIPDSNWSRKDIISWLGERNVAMSGYVTKIAALALVEETLNPTGDTEETTGDE